MGTKEDPSSFDCYEHAAPDEPLFVLLARDAMAPEAVRYWAKARELDLRAKAYSAEASASEVFEELDQIQEARRCADQMEAWRAARNTPEVLGDDDSLVS